MLRRPGLWVVLASLSATSLVGCPRDPGPERDVGVCQLIDVGPSFEPDDSALDAADAPDVSDVSDVSDPPKSLDAGALVTRAQIDAIFEVSCSFSTCHGQTGNPTAGLYLPKAVDGDWYPQLVDVRSKENPDMLRVKPYDPAKSWMAHKILGDNCTFTRACAKNDCGDRMPQANDSLPDDEIDTILRWIRQGAPAK